MVYDLAVVGGGFWGTATALRARARGWDVVLLDEASKFAGSRSASGYFTERWYTGKWNEAIRHAYAWANEAGVNFKHVGARLNTVQDRINRSPWHYKHRGDYKVFFPQQFLDLVSAEPFGKVERIVQEDGRKILLNEYDERIEAKRVVVAAGVWTDDLLFNSGLPTLGVGGLWGSAVYYREGTSRLRGMLADEFLVPILHEINPYKQIAIRFWKNTGVYGDVIRICATTEIRPEKRSEYIKKMVEAISYRIEGFVYHADTTGVRPVCANGFTMKQVAPGIAAISGGGKIGAVASFWMGEKALEMVA